MATKKTGFNKLPTRAKRAAFAAMEADGKLKSKGKSNAKKGPAKKRMGNGKTIESIAKKFRLGTPDFTGKNHQEFWVDRESVSISKMQKMAGSGLSISVKNGRIAGSPVWKVKIKKK